MPIYLTYAFYKLIYFLHTFYTNLIKISIALIEEIFIFNSKIKNVIATWQYEIFLCNTKSNNFHREIVAHLRTPSRLSFMQS